MAEVQLNPGDIVQITNDNNAWFPCLVTVSEVKAWGIMGYTIIPTNDEKANGQTYIRIGKDEYEKVGTVIVVSGTKEL